MGIINLLKTLSRLDETHFLLLTLLPTGEIFDVKRGSGVKSKDVQDVQDV